MTKTDRIVAWYVAIVLTLFVIVHAWTTFR